MTRGVNLAVKGIDTVELKVCCKSCLLSDGPQSLRLVAGVGVATSAAVGYAWLRAQKKKRTLLVCIFLSSMPSASSDIAAAVLAAGVSVPTHKHTPVAPPADIVPPQVGV